MERKYTSKQGQYLAFIYYYTKLNGYPPTEADMQRYFKVTKEEGRRKKEEGIFNKNLGLTH